MEDSQIILVIPWKQLADNDPWSLQVQVLAAKWWKNTSYSGRDLNDLGFSEPWPRLHITEGNEPVAFSGPGLGVTKFNQLVLGRMPKTCSLRWLQVEV